MYLKVHFLTICAVTVSFYLTYSFFKMVLINYEEVYMSVFESPLIGFLEVTKINMGLYAYGNIFCVVYIHTAWNTISYAFSRT